MFFQQFIKIFTRGSREYVNKKEEADNSQDSETKTFRTDHFGRLWCMFSQLNKYQRCNKQINKIANKYKVRFLLSGIALT